MRQRELPHDPRLYNAIVAARHQERRTCSRQRGTPAECSYIPRAQRDCTVLLTTVGHLQTNVAASNYVQHHDASVWGADHATYDPERWLDGRTVGLHSAVIPFSLGHRMCLGRNLAMTNILKTITTLLTRFELTLDGEAKLQPLRFGSSGVGQLQGTLMCTARCRS
jgi:cytochrome P450